MTEHGQKLIDIAKENGKREMGTGIKKTILPFLTRLS